MNRRQWMMWTGAAAAAASAQTPAAPQQREAGAAQDTPDKFLLKDYQPEPIFRVPLHDLKTARFPAIDAHSHPVEAFEGSNSQERVEELVKLMDTAGVQKMVVLTGAATPERFGQVCRNYARHPDRFEMWCGFDLRGVHEPGFGPGALKSLEECHRLGAAGAGEISDKGSGFSSGSSAPPAATASTTAGGYQGKGSGFRSPSAAPAGPHPDDPRMDAIWDKCAQLGMPVNIHVADPIWSYQPMDRTNDGLMTAYTWMIKVHPGMLGHSELVDSLERAVKKHRKTTFVACHLMNLDYDLARLGQILDRNPNLYVDVSARFANLATIPRFAAQFIRKYQDRVMYGTDLTLTQQMYTSTFRILETEDDHFYVHNIYHYHWPLHGLGLPEDVLRKVYGENARKVFQTARNNA